MVEALPYQPLAMNYDSCRSTGYQVSILSRWIAIMNCTPLVVLTYTNDLQEMQQVKIRIHHLPANRIQMKELFISVIIEVFLVIVRFRRSFSYTFVN